MTLVVAVPEQSSTVRIGRTTLRVVVRPGTGTGPPLLLCNGIGAQQEVLKPFVDALDPQITAVRFDVPGVGASPLPALPRTYHQLALLARRMMDRLGYQAFDVLGISWGGGLAQQIAFQHRRRCRRLVLCATATGWMMVPGKPQVLRHMVTPARYRDRDYVRNVAGTIYGGQMRTQPDQARALLVEGDRPPSYRAYAYQLLAAAGWTSLPWLPMIRQQTLIVHGTDDPVVPLANARILAALLPHARLHTYDDGHLGLVTRAEELAPVVSAFLLKP
ncbi:MAG: poly(3-hydroxyalkanoate) depolymerase [Frankiales bacterium]|nr:poly(3-hydroxyalkanoate) depolymerase [Frankiales bacterium]